MTHDSPVADMRRAAGLTQQELADRLDCKQQTVQKFERAGDQIKIMTLVKVARACGRKRVVIDVPSAAFRATPGEP